MEKDKDIITSQAVRQVLQVYLKQYRTYPWDAFLAFFMPAIGSIFIFFIPPLVVSRLINIFAAQHTIPAETKPSLASAEKMVRVPLIANMVVCRNKSRSLPPSKLAS